MTEYPCGQNSPRPYSIPMKYILVTGGVISGVGKGIISSCLGVLLKNSGYKVSAIKIDPYLNIDAGTFSPYEHGEVFVLDDGGEVDLDLGNYERFLNVCLTRDNNITTGKMFKYVTEKERRGDYMGKTVQMIPHFTKAIVEWIERVARIPVDGSKETPDICIIELGGTIGDIEGMAYLAAFERFQRPALRDHMMNVHVSLVLHPAATGEPKTKPMQNSVRQLREAGLVPDLLICRSSDPLQSHLRKYIADFGLVDVEQPAVVLFIRSSIVPEMGMFRVIGVHDVSNIYKVPLLLQEQNVLDAIIRRLHLPSVPESIRRELSFTMDQWTNLSNLVDSFKDEVTIALVGKYTKIEDAYASVNKALSHAAIHSRRKLKIKFVDSGLLEKSIPGQEEKYEEAWNARNCGAGGFDSRGVEGMIECCKYARANRVPFLGICLGMQCAAVEFARNVLGLPGANSTEFCKTLRDEQRIIIDMPEHDAAKIGLGGTMRLGRRSTVFLTEDSILRSLYGKDKVEERHRHRYEVNPRMVPILAKLGLNFVGMGVDEDNSASFIEERRSESSSELVAIAENKGESDLLDKIKSLCQRGGDGTTKPAVRMEIVELDPKSHPYFVGVQYHPEYLSSPLIPSPPFFGLILAPSGQLEEHLSGKKLAAPLNFSSQESLIDDFVAVKA